jgi:putative folate metabolism gamma-glutamate ligase
MHVKAVQTHRVQCGESLQAVLDQYIPVLAEQSIVAITSKIISFCQGQVVAKTACSKEEIIEREADAILDSPSSLYGVCLTMKDGILIPSAGIDESNGEDVYILYPKDVQQTAKEVWDHLRQKHGIKDLGIIITDSHTTPLRRGVTGIALGWCGFEPLHSYIGKPDIYGNPLKYTQINLLDALSTAAVLTMGEGNEQTPIALIQDAPKIQFLDRFPTAEEEGSISISMEEDLYAPFLMNASWIRRK